MTVTSPPLPPEQDELQALIEEARRRTRQRRRRHAVALVLVALSALVLYLLVVGARNRVAAPARGPHLAASPQVFGPGQFWYTRAVASLRDSEWAGGLVVRRNGYHSIGPRVQIALRVVEESWVGVDGTMRYRVVAIPRFASIADRAKWATYGRPLAAVTARYDMDVVTDGRDMFPPQLWYPGPWSEQVGTPADGPARVDVGDSMFTYRQLLALPVQAAALRARLIDAERALALRETHQGKVLFPSRSVATSSAPYNTLDTIAGLLASPLPAPLRQALVRAAVTLPATSVDGRAYDSLGRPGVAVSAPEPGSEGSRITRRLVLAPTAGALLEGGGLYRGAVVAQGVVDSIYALPNGVTSVRAVGAVPAPQTLSIAPAVANQTTVFKVTLSSPSRQRRRHAPTLDWSIAGTPPLRCFTSGRLPPLRPSATIRRAGTLDYIYRLKPPRAHGDTWCRGRYELQVAPTYARPLQPTRNQWFYPLHNSIRYQRFSSAIGSRIFFLVR